MIPAIQEINFPSYATLSQATVSLQEMGERTITSQIKIDGDVVPSFDGWELRFRGERFILPVKEPQATKDNTSRNSVIDITFQSWVVFQMRRYFFVSMSQIDAGTAIPDQYNASVSLPIEGFVQLFNKVLKYYFGDAIRMDLFGAGTPGLYSQEPVIVEINKTYIWDVLVKFYELFGYRWRIEYDSVSGAHVIKVNYTAPAITDHDFEYGYQGGLLKFERQVQDTNISNVLIGRGGEKNLPYRYFKLQDPNNTAFAADPDAIPELANIYFDRLRDANFRWYVRGWMQNENRDTSWDATHTFPTYTDADCPEPFLFAFHRGQTDEKFNPIEYVKDDASIAKYGERWGAVEDNDDAYPTIQGREVSGLGRVDEVVDVSPIVTDDIHEASKAAATRIEVAGTKVVSVGFDPSSTSQQDLVSEPFTIPDGQTGRIEYSILSPYNGKSGESYPGSVVAIDTTAFNLRAVDEATGTEYPAQGLNPGTYRLKFTLKATNYSTNRQTYVTYGFNSLQLILSSADADAWKPTFDIWVKNIWQSEQLSGESDEEYARRVWEPILGDRAGNEAKVVFSTGFMSTSQDYEFVIASYPVKDRSKTITSGGVNYDSEWKITLRKSDAEFEATGLYIPNATTGGAPAAGDHFFFIGIDMPFQYVVWGEEFLNGALNTPVVNKTAALEKLADINPSWVIQLDKVRCNTHEGAEYGQHLADRLSAGATVNIRDVRFTGGQVLTLYVQTINYVWNEPTDDSPYLVPDIEVVLSDKVVATEGPVTRVSNELETVKSTYAKSADIEQVVRAIGNSLFLKKTGESDRSASPTSFASAVNSDNFRPGDFGGAGWGHYEDSDGDAVLEVDRVVARKELRVNSLVANQVAYVGGKSVRSAASIQCTQVVEDNNYYYCYFDQKQGSVANLFLVGDFAMGQDFDENNAETRYYRMTVSGVGVDYIRLSKAGRDGQGAPMKGDTIVQYGHANDAARQYVIVEDVIGGGYQRMLSGLNTVNAGGKEYYFAGRQPNVGERWFVGDVNGEHAEWKNGQLNITGRLSVRDANGNYQAMDTYMSGVSQAIINLQAQIDGQIQSWASGEAPSPQTEPLPKINGGVVDPSTANFPASGWPDNIEREKHVGDIYVDDSTGQGYRYTKRLMNGVTEYYWTRITDEELARALADIQALQQQYAGLVYLKNALEESTVVQGGLILSSLIQLGYTSGQTYTVMAGINGKPDQSLADQTRSIAAWYGGPMVDHEADPSAANYAKSLFRFDGSGYLAGGNITWNKLGYGGIPGITWSRENGQDVVTIGGNVKLESVSGDTVTELINLVRTLSSMFIDDTYTVDGQTKHRIKVNSTYFEGLITTGFLIGAADGGPGGGGGGGIDLNLMWASLQNTTPDTHATDKFHVSHLPAIVASDGISAGYTLDSGNLATHLNIGISAIDQSKVSGLSTALAGKADVSALNDMATMTWVGQNYAPIANAVKYTDDGSSIGSGSPFSGAVAYVNAINLPNHNALVYNTSGYEYSMLFSFASYGFSNGTILRWGHSEKYLYIARLLSDSWQSNDWEKISAGYADDSGKLNGQSASYYATAGSLGDYLPLTAGSSKPISGALYISTATDDILFINNTTTNATAAYARFRLNGTDKASIGYDSSFAFLCNEAASGYPRIGVSNAGVPEFWSSYQPSSANTIYHSGNSNLTTVPWSASSLTLAGAISGATNIDSLLYFDTTNSRVGIGTGSPLAKLDVNGTTYFRENIAHYFRDPNQSSWRTGVFYGTDGWESLAFVATNTHTTFRFCVGNDISTWTYGTYNTALSQLVVGYNGVSVAGTLRVSEATTLGSSLTLVGSIIFNDTQNSKSLITNNYNGGVYSVLHDHYASGNISINACGGDIYFGYWNTAGYHFYTNGTEKVTIDGSGNVGIGTTSPLAKFHLAETNAGDFLISRSNANGAAILDLAGNNQTTNVWRISGSDPASGLFQIIDRRNSTEYSRFAISSSGYVGIGTDSPKAKLDVQGTSYMYENTPHYFRGPDDGSWRSGFYYGTNGWESLAFAVAHTNTTIRFCIGSDIGSWNSGSWQSATSQLVVKYDGIDVAGVIHATTGVISPGYGNFAASYSNSDQRLKDDIKEIDPEYALEKLMSLRPCEWVWNERSSQAGKKGAGFIAQQVSPFFGFTVARFGEYMSINYDNYHGYEVSGIKGLYKMVKELKKEVSDQAEEIRILRSENAKLKERINA